MPWSSRWDHSNGQTLSCWLCMPNLALPLAVHTSFVCFVLNTYYMESEMWSRHTHGNYSVILTTSVDKDICWRTHAFLICSSVHPALDLRMVQIPSTSLTAATSICEWRRARSWWPHSIAWLHPTIISWLLRVWMQHHQYFDSIFLMFIIVGVTSSKLWQVFLFKHFKIYWKPVGIGALDIEGFI